MSRSRKKVSSFVDPSNTSGKRIGSRIMRRKTKELLKNDPDSELPKSKSEVINDYSVCDYRFILWDERGDETYKKGLRK
jgi:hypothetical protein